MKTILFTWNPNKWKWDDLPQAVCDANKDGFYLSQWSCGSARHIERGDRAFLIRLGVVPKGIIGSGVIASEPFQGPHWDQTRAENGEQVYRVKIVFDVLNDVPLLSEQDLNTGVLGGHNWFPQASGTQIPQDIASALEGIWEERTSIKFDPPAAEDFPTLYLEGTKRSRLIKTYERSSEAVTACKQYHGTQCKGCGLQLGDKYGDIGLGYIHAHHVVPVSQKDGKEYHIDPINDLVPLCPNCHAMIHRRTPPFTVEELRQRLR